MEVLWLDISQVFGHLLYIPSYHMHIKLLIPARAPQIAYLAASPSVTILSGPNKDVCIAPTVLCDFCD
jgi:hypothetical protein